MTEEGLIVCPLCDEVWDPDAERRESDAEAWGPKAGEGERP